MEETEIPVEEPIVAVVAAVPVVEKATVRKEGWTPRTEVGRLVQKGEITSITQVIDRGEKIVETEIIDILLPNMKSDLLMVGQSKGKFGGGQKRVFKQTQKKTKEGNKPKFATFAVVGNEDGYVGIGYGKAKETVPAREKAIRNAKLNVIKIKRGCGSWECGCKGHHSIPFKVTAKVGSIELTLIPAPKGTGLIVEPECQKILSLAGIKDVWSKTKGQTRTKNNMITACYYALRNLMGVKLQHVHNEPLGIIEGARGEAKNE
ncbi:30S ribosomal protein S5 [Candidatus Woesearchaeota archaeon]|nr:30S ribosomal protein S5 [Candidatus Woesearchaeota archaeon]